MSLRVVPITLAEAKRFVGEHHRHNSPPVGWKFGVGVELNETLVGVATAGRPVSRVLAQDRFTLEVNRTCTDGALNANSMLYGAIWRAAKALGYLVCITYLQGDEDGASLKAAGWLKVRDIPARGSWAEHSVARRAGRDPVGTGGMPRQLWAIGSLPQIARQAVTPSSCRRSPTPTP